MHLFVRQLIDLSFISIEPVRHISAPSASRLGSFAPERQ